MKHKVRKSETPHTPTPVNARRQNEFSLIIENHNWKEDYITISLESRLKKVMVETEKVYKLLPNIPTSNITELKDLIHMRAKLICDKIGISQRKQNNKYKIWIGN